MEKIIVTEVKEKKAELSVILATGIKGFDNEDIIIIQDVIQRSDGKGTFCMNILIERSKIQRLIDALEKFKKV